MLPVGSNLKQSTLVTLDHCLLSTRLIVHTVGSNTHRIEGKKFMTYE